MWKKNLKSSIAQHNRVLLDELEFVFIVKKFSSSFVELVLDFMIYNFLSRQYLLIKYGSLHFIVILLFWSTWRWNILRTCEESYFGYTNNQVYIDWVYMYECLQQSGYVNLKVCTFICWDSLVDSAAVAEYDGSMWYSACRQGHCCSGASAVVIVQRFAQPGFGGTVPSVKQCLMSAQRLGHPVFTGTTVGHVIRGHWAVIVSTSRKTKECGETLPKHGLFLCNYPSLSVICWYFDENSN